MLRMNCKRVKKGIPLLAGKDLPRKKLESLIDHLEKCPLCQQELEEYKLALERIKILAQEEEKKDWAEAEWKALMERAIAQKGERIFIPAGWLQKRKYALAFIPIMFIASIGIVYIFWNRLSLKPREIPFKPEKTIAQKVELPPLSPEKIIEVRTKIASPTAFSTAESAEKAETPETLTLVLVSPETGLKITWIFNKNFEWKEEEK